MITTKPIKWPHFPELTIEAELWPEILEQKTYRDAREIVEAKVVQLCIDGDLYLTELMNQDSRCTNLVGDVILGFGLEDGEDGGERDTQVRRDIPLEVADARVLVESIDRGCTEHRDEPAPKDKPCGRCARDRAMSIVPIGLAPIEYIDGMEPINTRSAGRSRRNRSPQQQKQERFVRGRRDKPFGTSEMLPLRAAWLCLKHNGAYVRRAPHPDDQEMFWLYREVSPAEIAQREASKGTVSKGAKR